VIRTNAPTPMWPRPISKWEHFTDWLFNKFRCRFCHKACQKFDAYSFNETMAKPFEVLTWRCEPCQVRYLENWEGKIYKTAFWTTLNNKLYYVWTGKETTFIEDEYGWLMQLDYVLPITPNNINQKLKTLLTFQ
jgi:hypothetical protein